MINIEIPVDKLLWLNNFCSKDLTETRGFAQIILTKIQDIVYLIATNGHICIFYKVDEVNSDKELENGKNYCIYLGKKEINYLKNINNFEYIHIDFEKGEFWSSSLPRIFCFQYRKCDFDFENWLKWIKGDEKLQQQQNNLYKINYKLLKSFCYGDDTLVFSSYNDKVLYVQIPNLPNCFGFLSKMYDNNIEFNENFKNFKLFN